MAYTKSHEHKKKVPILQDLPLPATPKPLVIRTVLHYTERIVQRHNSSRYVPFWAASANINIEMNSVLSQTRKFKVYGHPQQTGFYEHNRNQGKINSFNTWNKKMRIFDSCFSFYTVWHSVSGTKEEWFARKVDLSSINLYLNVGKYRKLVHVCKGTNESFV